MFFATDVSVEISFAHCNQVANFTTYKNVSFFLCVRENWLDFSCVWLNVVLVQGWIGKDSAKIRPL